MVLEMERSLQAGNKFENNAPGQYSESAPCECANEPVFYVERSLVGRIYYVKF